MSIRQRVMSALVGLVCSSVLPCHAGILYANDFGNKDAAGWSVGGNSGGISFSEVNNTLSGFGNFFGEYSGGDVVNFGYQNSALNNSRVTLQFNFFALRSWDGNDPLYGRDSFKVVANNSTLLDKTFSNGWASQTFTRDGSAPNGVNDTPMAGSVQQYALGYKFWDGINNQYWYQDAVYQLSFVFDSFSDLLNLSFSTQGLQRNYVENDPDGTRYLDESWGLDNVQLSVVALANGSDVPEPTTVSMFIFGILAAARSLKKRSRNSPKHRPYSST